MLRLMGEVESPRGTGTYTNRLIIPSGYLLQLDVNDFHVYCQSGCDVQYLQSLGGLFTNDIHDTLVMESSSCSLFPEFEPNSLRGNAGNAPG